MGPVPEMVGVTPRRRAVASVPSTAAIAQVEGPANGRCDRALRPSDVEGLSLGPDDDPHHSGVTRQAADGLERDGGAVDLGEALMRHASVVIPCRELGEIDRDGDMRLRPAGAGC